MKILQTRFGRATVSELLEKRLLARNHCTNFAVPCRRGSLHNWWLMGTSLTGSVSIMCHII